jgi:hypothetical protein
MSTTAMATFALDQIDQVRAERGAVSKQTNYERLEDSRVRQPPYGAHQ